MRGQGRPSTALPAIRTIAQGAHQGNHSAKAWAVNRYHCQATARRGFRNHQEHT